MNRKLVRLIREILLRFEPFARAKIRRAIDAAEQMSSCLIDHSGLDVIDANELIARLTSQRNGRNICHVIGSGASVLKTKRIIEDDSAVYICNFGGVLAIPADLYLIEFCNASEISDLQMKAVNACNPKLLVLKNFWDGRVEAKHAPNAPLVKDILLPFGDMAFKLGHHDTIIDFLIEPPGQFLRQFQTTVITMTLLAYFAGFTRIVVHGLDGGGPHVYHELDTPLAQAIAARLPGPQKRHIVGAPAIEFLRSLSVALAQKGVIVKKST